VAGGGTLYREVFSEYPVAANLVFGAVRGLSLLLPLTGHALTDFTVFWVAAGLAAVAAGALLARRHGAAGAGWAWVLPAVVYFAAYRFDVYPALAAALSFALLKKERLGPAAWLLGVCIALKGYALLSLPAVLFYVHSRAGTAAALRFLLWSLTPQVATTLLAIPFSGVEGVLSAYVFHAQRGLSGQSAWDALGLGRLVQWEPRLPALVAVLSSVAGALMRPRTLGRLVDACLVAVVGFTVSLVFYSPQFCLWFLALGSFSERRVVLALTSVLCLANYLYFPVAYDYDRLVPGVLAPAVLGVTLLRLALIVVCAVGGRASGESRPAPNAAAST
jgi:hypothetical protein